MSSILYQLATYCGRTSTASIKHKEYKRKGKEEGDSMARCIQVASYMKIIGRGIDWVQLV
jgi:hypothetical protein